MPSGTRYPIKKGQEIEVDGGEGGSFEAVVAFSTKTGSTCAICVNGEEQSIVSFPKVGSWTEKKTVKMTLTLKSGANKLEIRNQGKKGVNFAYIDLKTK